MNWQKTAFLVLLAGLLAVFAPRLVRQWKELGRLQRMEERGREEEQRRRRCYVELVRRKEDLATDPERIELLAREKLGLVKENEIVFVFEPTPVPEGEYAR